MPAGLTVAALNGLTRHDFVALVGPVYEKTKSVAEQAFDSDVPYPSSPRWPSLRRTLRLTLQTVTSPRRSAWR